MHGAAVSMRSVPVHPIHFSEAQRIIKLHGIWSCAHQTKNVPKMCAVAVLFISVNTKERK